MGESDASLSSLSFGIPPPPLGQPSLDEWMGDLKRAGITASGGGGVVGAESPFWGVGDSLDALESLERSLPQGPETAPAVAAGNSANDGAAAPLAVAETDLQWLEEIEKDLRELMLETAAEEAEAAAAAAAAAARAASGVAAESASSPAAAAEQAAAGAGAGDLFPPPLAPLSAAEQAEQAEAEAQRQARGAPFVDADAFLHAAEAAIAEQQDAWFRSLRLQARALGRVWALFYLRSRARSVSKAEKPL